MKIESREVQGTGLEMLVEEISRDKKPAQHEEQIHPHETTGEKIEALSEKKIVQMSEKNSEHRQPSQAIQRGQVDRPR